MPGPLLRRVAPLAAAAALSAVHFGSFEVRTPPIVTDARYYLYFAWRMSEGAVLHRDLFDNKTQLASFLGVGFYEAGSALGVDPLFAIRAGYLALAALGGVLAFAVFRRLGAGRGTAGLLGALAYCASPLLGLMPSIGPVPKLVMALMAPAMALALRARRFVLAGACGALAFMDWQIGAGVWLAAGVTALALEGRGERGRAVLRLVAGGLLGAAPFAAYFLATGALGAMLDQTVVASFFRGAYALEREGFAVRLERLRMMGVLSSPGQLWIYPVVAVGAAVVAVWLWRRRRDEDARLLLPLALYHAGLLGFSLVDFQWYGDFFVVLHSVAFFLAAAWVAAYLGVLRLVTPRGPRFAPAAVAVLAVSLAVGFARPGPMKHPLEIFLGGSSAGLTLAEQEEVAARVADRLRGKRSVLLGQSELLFLLRLRNPLPTIFWNNATWSRYREGDESSIDTLTRLLRKQDPDVFVYPDWLPVRADLDAQYTTLRIVSSTGRYAAVLHERALGSDGVPAPDAR